MSTIYTLANFSVSNSGAITGGSSVTGTISASNELDLFSMSLTAGTTYEFTLKGLEWATATGSTWTLEDPYLVISGPGGSNLFVSCNDDGGSGSDSHLFFTPTVSGTYGIGVIGNGGLGTYQITAGYSDDIGSSTASFANMTPFSSFDREAEIGAAGDHDWFKVAWAPNTTYTIRVDPSGGDGSLTALEVFDPSLRIRNASGTILATDDDGAGFYTSSQITFTTGSAAGVYYLDVGAFGDMATGAFVIHVTPNAAPWDDAGASTSSFFDMTDMPSREDGMIQFPGDHDWYRVSLVSGTTYTIDSMGFDTMEGSLLNPFMALRSSSGAVISQNDDGGLGRNARITYTATSTGYYYIDISASNGVDAGSYNVSINNQPFSLPGADPNDFHMLAPGYYQDVGINNPGEVATAYIYCQAGTTYTLAANRFGASGGEGGLTDPFLQVLTPNGGGLLWSDDNSGPGSNALLTFTPTATSYYMVNVGGTGGTTGHVQVFFNSGSSATLDDIGNSTANYATTALGKISYATIDSGSDHDWFAITLAAGTTYSFGVNSSSVDPILSPLDSADVAIRNASGVQLTSTAGTGSGSTVLTYAPTATGTYYVDVSGHSSVTGLYTLYTALGPSQEIGATTGSFADLALRTATTGTLGTAADHDWYRVFLTAGMSYSFDLMGHDNYRGTLLDPKLVLRNPFGVAISTDDNSGQRLNARLSYTATSSGYYFLDAGSSANRYAGTFTILARHADDYGSTTAQHGSISLNTARTGLLETGSDSDWFEVNLSAGAYVFNAAGDSTGNGSLRDPVVSLRNASGTLLGRDDNSGAGLDGRLVYTVTSAGTYYVEVNSFMGAFNGNYTAYIGVLDDYGSTTASFGSLTGTTATGALETATDRDWFRVVLGAGTYTFNVYGHDTGVGNLHNPMLTLRNSAGVVVVSDNDSGVGSDARITRTLTAGTYYLEVSSFSSAYAGTYEVSIGTADEHGASTATAGAIGLGAENAVIGSLEVAGDHDWYQIYLAAGSYVFDLQGAPTNKQTLADPYLTLRNTGGALVTVDDNSGLGLNSRISASIATAGWYFLDVGGYSNAYAGSYRLIATSTGFDDFGSSTSSAGVIGVGGERAMRGALETLGDQDWFQIFLAAGSTYTFDVEGISTGQGSLASPFALLRMADGTAVASDMDSGVGLNSRFTYTASTTGQYYLDVRALTDAWTGSYRVSVSQAATSLDDNGASTASYGVLGTGLDGVANGCIETLGDHDWYRINLVSGYQYTFDLKGASASGGSLVTPAMALRNASGGSIVSSTNTLLDSRITWTATATGYYYLDVQSFANLGMGSYTLTAINGPNALDDCGSTTASYAITGVGRSVRGVLERSADHDWYGVYLTVGTAYTFALQGDGSNCGSLVNPALFLRNASGTILRSNDNYSTLADARITYTAAVTGWYFLDAFSGATNNGPGSYTLTAAQGSAALDDYGSTAGTAPYVNAGNSIYGAIENSGDLDWFTVTLTGGLNYLFDVYGSDSGNGSLADPSLRLLRPGSLAQAAADDNSGAGLEAHMEYTPSETGIYRVEVSGHAGLGGYRLEMVATSPLGGLAETTWLANTSDLSLSTNVVSGGGLSYTFSDAERSILNATLAA